MVGSPSRGFSSVAFETKVAVAVAARKLTDPMPPKSSSTSGQFSNRVTDDAQSSESST